MSSHAQVSIELSVPDASADLTFNAAQGLINELNRELGQVAQRKSQDAAGGTRGDLVTVGQIALALISAGITKQIAQVLISYIKRNPRYTIQIGKIKLTKDFVSTKDVAAMNALVEELKRNASDLK
jgi:hypothetical protein